MYKTINHKLIFWPTKNSYFTLLNLTQSYQPPAVLSINNPYAYPYTYNSNNQPVFLLPNGTTSTDPLTRIYNTIAKNLNNLTTASTSASSTISYTKFTPFPDYEYDTRGVITINIPFNGKVVGTYKYDAKTGSTLSPEISYFTLNHLGSPTILADTSAQVTQKIKRDEWGNINQNVYDNQAVTNTNVGFTNQKQDIDSNLTYIHARYLSTANKTWLSYDPFSLENFNSDIWLNNPALQNSYSYSTNDPVNKLDPDGRLTIIVPGTYYKYATWNVGGDMRNLRDAARQQYGEDVYVFNNKSLWSGGNQPGDRSTAALKLKSYIEQYEFKDGEKLNLVMHSHGGNVGKELSHILDRKIDNFVTIGTPVRDDYTINYSNVDSVTEAYSDYDFVQSNGGNKYKIPGHEGGPAKRFERNGNSLNLTNHTSPGQLKNNQSFSAHSEMYKRNDSLQQIFSKYTPNTMNINYMMGTIKIN